jgi:hypothetical protein
LGAGPLLLLSRPDARAVPPPAAARQAARPRPGRAACPRFGALGRLCRRVLLVWAKVWGLRVFCQDDVSKMVTNF